MLRTWLADWSEHAFTSTEAFLGAQRLAQCIKHDGKAQKEDDAGDTVKKRRNAGDWEFDGP